MTERVPAPAADERDLRTPRIEQFLRSRCAAAVVCDLEDAYLRRHQAWNDGALDVAADVAGQEQRDVAVEHLEDHGIVVAHPLPFPLRRGRMKNEHSRGPDAEPFALAPFLDVDVRRGGTREQRLQRYGARDRYPLPHGCGTEVVDERRPAADVIRTAMRAGQRIHPPTAARPQGGHANASAGS